MPRINRLHILLGACLLVLAAPILAGERIVSTDASVTQILFALQLDSALVGVDVTSQLPENYRPLPNIGYHRALSAEGLLALQPTLVIGSEHIGPPKVLSTLAAANVHLLQLPTATTVDGLQDNIRRIVQATGAQETGEELLSQLDSQAAQVASTPLGQERIAFVLSVEPGKLRIAGKGTAGHAFIELLGSENIADFDGYRTLSAEAILQLDPSVILVASHEDATPERALQLNPILKHGRAAKSEQVLQADAANLVAGLSPGAVADAASLIARMQAQAAAR